MRGTSAAICAGADDDGYMEQAMDPGTGVGLVVDVLMVIIRRWQWRCGMALSRYAYDEDCLEQIYTGIFCARSTYRPLRICQLCTGLG